MSEFYTITQPRAAKPYKCEECCGPIAVGERYCRHAGKQEGYMFTAIVCDRCQGMRGAAWDAFAGEWFEGPAFGELRNELREEHGIADPEAWYDAILAERKAQQELRDILGAALRNYQTGLSAYQNEGMSPDKRRAPVDQP